MEEWQDCGIPLFYPNGSRAIARCHVAGDPTIFIEFMLSQIDKILEEISVQLSEENEHLEKLKLDEGEMRRKKRAARAWMGLYPNRCLNRGWYTCLTRSRKTIRSRKIPVQPYRRQSSLQSARRIKAGPLWRCFRIPGTVTFPRRYLKHKNGCVFKKHLTWFSKRYKMVTGLILFVNYERNFTLWHPSFL